MTHTQTDGRVNKHEVGYENQMAEFMDKTDLKNYMNDPFLFMRRQRVAEYLGRVELFQKIQNVAGSIVECGVKRGGSLMLYSHLSSCLEPFNLNRKIYGFDTFEGFRSINKDKDLVRVNESMFADVSYDTLKKSIEIQDLNRPIGHIPKVELIKGDACKTIPEFVKQRPELTIALLYIDFDIYEPTKVAIQHLLPLVPRGGIVVFDEFNDERWPGETTAVKELLNLRELKMRRFTYDPQPAYFIVGE